MAMDAGNAKVVTSGVSDEAHELQRKEAELHVSLRRAYVSLRRSIDDVSTAAACQALRKAAQDMHAVQLQLLPVSCPSLPDLPDAILERVLQQAGLHTRRVCKRFHAIHPAKPTNLFLQGGDGTPIQVSPQALSCLPHIAGLDLTFLPSLHQSIRQEQTVGWGHAAVLILQATTCLRTFTVGPDSPYNDFKPIPDNVLLQLRQHASSLHELSCNIRNDSSTTVLLELTALRSLHLPKTTQFKPHIWEGLRALPLTRLDMGPMGDSERGCTTHMLAAVAQLPHLVDLRLPATMIWHVEHCAHLQSMTRLRALRIGGCPMLLSNVHAVRMLAALTNLTELELVDPVWLPAPSGSPSGPTECLVAALQPLSLTLRFCSNMGFADGLDAPWNKTLALFAASWCAVTHLELAAASQALVEEAQEALGFNVMDHVTENWLFRQGHLWLRKRTLHGMAGSLRSLRLWRVLVPCDLFKLLARQLRCLERLGVEECCYKGKEEDKEMWEPIASGMDDFDDDDSDLFPMRFFGLRGLTTLTELRFCSHGETAVGGVYGQEYELPFLTALQKLAMPDWEPDSAEELWVLLPLQQLRELTLGNVNATYGNGVALGLQGTCEILRSLQGLTRLRYYPNSSKPRSLSVDDIQRIGAASAASPA